MYQYYKVIYTDHPHAYAEKIMRKEDVQGITKSLEITADDETDNLAEEFSKLLKRENLGTYIRHERLD